jgi:hypothetical protein
VPRPIVEVSHDRYHLRRRQPAVAALRAHTLVSLLAASIGALGAQDCGNSQQGSER